MVDCCVAIDAPILPSLTVFVRYCCSPCIRLVVMLLFHLQQPQQFTIIVVFFAIFSPLFRLIAALFLSLSAPITPSCTSVDCQMVIVGFCGPLLALHLCPEVNSGLVPSAGSWILVLSRGSVFDRYGGWISTADTAAGRGGLHDDLVMVMVGFSRVWAATFGGCQPWSGWLRSRFLG